jgi:hypothetical protein
MTLRAAQATIFSLLLLTLAIVVGSLSYAYMVDEYFPDHLQALLLQALAQFAGPLSVVIGSFFALRRSAQRTIVPSAVFYLSMACVTLWSLLIAGRTVTFIASDDEIVEMLVSWFSNVTTAASFLVTGVLAYFFASQKP